MSEWYYVEIRRYGGDETDPGYTIMGPNSRHNAEKIRSGAGRNLNHRDYYTTLVPESELTDAMRAALNKK